LHHGHVLAANSPDEPVILVPDNVLHEFGVSTVASRFVVEPDGVVEDSPQARVISSADVSFVVGGSHGVYVGAISTLGVNTFDGPGHFGGVSGPLGVLVV